MLGLVYAVEQRAVRCTVDVARVFAKLCSATTCGSRRLVLCDVGSVQWATVANACMAVACAGWDLPDVRGSGRLRWTACMAHVEGDGLLGGRSLQTPMKKNAPLRLCMHRRNKQPKNRLHDHSARRYTAWLVVGGGGCGYPRTSLVSVRRVGDDTGVGVPVRSARPCPALVGTRCCSGTRVKREGRRAALALQEGRASALQEGRASAVRRGETRRTCERSDARMLRPVV